MARIRSSRKQAPTGVDRLSALPDELLHTVMSFLPAPQAVQTSELSQRWRELWRTMPCLDIDIRDFPSAASFRKMDGGPWDGPWRKLENFATNLLMFHAAPVLDSSGYTSAGRTTRWNWRASFAGTQRFDRGVPPEKAAPMPREFGCRLRRPPGDQAKLTEDEKKTFPKLHNLKTLLMGECNMREEFDVLRFFLENVPSLEKVTLRHCEYPGVWKDDVQQDLPPQYRKLVCYESQDLNLIDIKYHNDLEKALGAVGRSGCGVASEMMETPPDMSHSFGVAVLIGRLLGFLRVKYSGKGNI
ncbi:hypothetical protein EJB05_37847, partial [Eragrostis curvula]